MKSISRLATCVLLGIAALAQSNSVPLISQLAPLTARPGGKGFELKVTGAGFAPSAILNWNGSPRTTEVVSGSVVKAAISAADIAQIGTVSVTVVNPAPGGGTSNIAFFPVRRALPSVALAWDANLNATGSLGVGDFNRDGKLDVVEIENEYKGQSNSINVYYGNGDGSFQPPVQTSISFSGYGPVVADFNGDGILDLAITNDGGDYGSTAIFLGTGDGHFSEVSNDYLGAGVVGVADFNHDGKLDLEIAGWDYGAYFYISPGNGDGTFGAETLTFSADESLASTVGDFNHDGVLDLAILSDSYDNGYTLSVMLGIGDGTFAPPVTYPDDRGGYYVLAADVNGDGILDIVTDGICTFLGSKGGTFQPEQCIDNGPTFGSPITAADFNGDGKIDLVTSDSQGNVLILLGNGDGTFQSPISLAEPAASLVAIGDFNQDGMLDLVTSGSAGPMLFLQTTASVDPTTLAFGSQLIDIASQPQSVMLTNIGKRKLKISSIAIAGTDPQDFGQTNNCGKGLEAGASCQIQAMFTPTTLGARTANVTIYSPDLSVPQTVPLSGTGSL